MITQKLETPWQIPKCDAETQREQRLLEKQRQKSHSTQRHHKPSVCKKKKNPADFGSAVEWSSMSRLPVSGPSPLRRAPTAPWSGHACGFLRKDTGGELSTLQVLGYVFSVLTPDLYSARAQTSKLENHFPLQCCRCCSILPGGGGVWSCRSSETSFVLPGDVGFPLSRVLKFTPQTYSKVLGDFPESYLCLTLPHCLVYILEFLLVFFLNVDHFWSLYWMLQHCFCFVSSPFGCEACGILVPQPGLKTASPALTRWSQPGTTREALSSYWCLTTLLFSFSLVSLSSGGLSSTLPSDTCVSHSAI